ncbi:class I SAM-dependent methyltransferase [Chitinophaga pendula]|uniref:class I SAM-dependent methyltransferase n=1 Tax=Chitinophaga TaxID=79328 RepID=UPI000BAF9D30|nr:MULTISPECIES: class I SAM-dependent methyltransferase [Chitinophaga]ASZ12551.1 hypothetical protein CK934_17090 [Chitinophaga sp. MD30]UCJ09845.1 class I SAM-dependent methyltransferase [Chitinophaga pendula]
MREENLQRLSGFTTNLNDPYYLHYKFLFRDIIAATKEYAKGEVFDIGCGNKPYAPLFTHCSKYDGCDIIQSSGHQVDILCPCTDIPLADNSYDTIFTTQVMEHVAEHQKMLSEAYRIVRPGGYIILTAPMYWHHHEEPYDFFRFTRYGMEHLFTKAGFTELQIIPNGGKWALTGQALLNSIRSSLYGSKKSLTRKILKAGFILFRIKWLINIFYGMLEKYDTDHSSTLNFLVVGKKPSL